MSSYRRLVLATLCVPTVNAALGIDGGAIFQILAIENLGLSAEALGIGFGLGILSVPLQLWAARMPLWRARRNIQLFLGLSAAQCAVLAGVVAFTDHGDRLAVAALAITVVAEITLSVLWATAYQPLVSFGLDDHQRQRINSRWGATSRAGLAVVAIVFGAANETARIVFLLAAAAVCVVLIVAMRGVAAPARPPRPDPDAALPDPLAGPRVSPQTRRLFVAIGLMAASAWPMYVVYAQEVLWPSVNLGVLAALRLLGSVSAAFAWRPTEGDIGARGRGAALAGAATAVALASLPEPVDTPVEAVVAVVLTAAGAAFHATVFMTLMELAHRALTEATAVRSMTLYDVVASTSMQASLLAGGFLVGLSGAWTGWGTDPYRAYLVASGLAVWAALRWSTEATRGQPTPAPRPADR